MYQQIYQDTWDDLKVLVGGFGNFLLAFLSVLRVHTKYIQDTAKFPTLFAPICMNLTILWQIFYLFTPDSDVSKFLANHISLPPGKGVTGVLVDYFSALEFIAGSTALFFNVVNIVKRRHPEFLDKMYAKILLPVGSMIAAFFTAHFIYPYWFFVGCNILSIITAIFAIFYNAQKDKRGKILSLFFITLATSCVIINVSYRDQKEHILLFISKGYNSIRGGVFLNIAVLMDYCNKNTKQH